MKIEVVLPKLFFSDLAKTEMPANGHLFFDASDLKELHKEFIKKYPALVNRLWDEKENIRKDIIIVVNDNLIKKNEYEILSFPNQALVEIMTQFAGG